MIKLAVDAMGGDKAPFIVIEGLGIAAKRHPLAHFMVYGDAPLLEPLIAEEPLLKDRITVHHTPEKITSDTKPTTALKGFKDSSMRLAINAAASGDCQGVVSAGNTGAYMVLSRMILKTLPGIDRPAIVGLIPTMKGDCVMLDLGANAECSAKHLVQFAIMGELFAKLALSIPKPSVGLLNVGSEDMKGNTAVREAAQKLKETKIVSHFYGFIEGDDICRGTVDVVVTDGFTGNVALKMGEGTLHLVTYFIKKGFENSRVARLGYFFVKPVLAFLKNRLDPRHYNGALFIGLNGVAVKSHGGTDALGFASAVTVALNMITSNANAHICRELKALAQKESADNALELS